MEEEYDDVYPPRRVSYLQARDPSILSWNRPGATKVRQNLADKFTSQSTFIEIPNIRPEKKEEGLRVYLKIKGGVPASDLYKIDNDVLVCEIPEEAHCSRNKREKSAVLKKFTFTNIFGPNTSQEDLFDTIIKDKLLSFINGHNSTLLAYGASGSGKTFTMVGTAERPGIIPRSLDYLFRTIPKIISREPTIKPLAIGTIQGLNPEQAAKEIDELRNILLYPLSFTERGQHIKTYNEMQRRLSNNPVGISEIIPPIVSVWVSFAEIYNENIYDLLEPPPGRGQQRSKLRIGGIQDDTFIRGLKYIYVRSGLEAYQVLQYGLNNLSYAATAVNHHSSRSHCIFSIRLIAGKNESDYSLSVFNFCDLAGTERLKKTMNEGDRLKESTKINTSLSVLGRCISNIRDKQQSVKDSCNAPFRDSKLTQLFQKALQGKEEILMIVNISPSLDMYDDTQHALMFSAIAKQIVTREAPSKILRPNRVSSYHQDLSPYLEEGEREELEELRDERANLVLELSELRQRVAAIVEEERNHLKTTYDDIIEVKDSQMDSLRQQVKRLTNTVKQLENEGRELRRDLRQQTVDEVIVLSSDSESEAETPSSSSLSRRCLDIDLENLKKLHQLEIERIQREHEEIVNKLRNEVKELQAILEVGKGDFNELSRKYESLRVDLSDLTNKNLTLEYQVASQNEELDDLRPRVLEQTEQIERLEDQIQALERLTNPNNKLGEAEPKEQLQDVQDQNVVILSRLSDLPLGAPLNTELSMSVAVLQQCRVPDLGAFHTTAQDGFPNGAQASISESTHESDVISILTH